MQIFLWKQTKDFAIIAKNNENAFCILPPYLVFRTSYLFLYIQWFYKPVPLYSWQNHIFWIDSCVINCTFCIVSCQKYLYILPSSSDLHTWFLQKSNCWNIINFDFQSFGWRLVRFFNLMAYKNVIIFHSLCDTKMQICKSGESILYYLIL